MPPIAAVFMNLVSLALSFDDVVVVVVVVFFDMLLLVDCVAPGCESMDPPPDDPEVFWAISAGPTIRRPVRVAAIARLLLFVLMVSPLLSG
jgi:hypothetical protein